MAAKAFVIDMRIFPKKGDAHAFFKQMLNRYNPGDRVTDTDAADLAALLKCHTDYAAKVGSGIGHFRVMKNLYNTQCFEIIRTDGTRDDFSYKHCITPKRD
jgi:hypothetical protein